MDFTVKKAEVRKLMQEFSKDGSDEIDHDEFMQISKSTLPTMNLSASLPTSYRL